jgi:DNA-binding NarL/FixJ family response regulator
MIRVAIADDHKIFRKGIVASIGDYDQVRLVQEASNGKQLLEGLDQYEPDVVLMDVKMPVMDGVEATGWLKSARPEVKVIALSMYDEDQYVLNMMQAGAKGYLLKNAEPDEILQAVTTVYSRQFYFNEQLSVCLLKKLLSHTSLPQGHLPPTNLNEREIHILQLVCQEYSNVEIAEKLFLSVRTVEGYRSKLFEKIKAKNIVGLVIYAIKHRLIDIQSWRL